MKPTQRAWIIAVLWGFLASLGLAAPVSLVVLSPERTVTPRSVTTLAFRLTNLGDLSDTYNLTFDLPPGFSVLAAPETLALEPGEAKMVLLSLFVSAHAPAGQHELVLRAQSCAEPTHVAEAKACLIVLPQVGVELRLPAGAQGWSGAKITYTLWVVNRGNALDSFRVEVQCSWRCDVSPSVVHLGPNEAAEVILTLTIPETAKPGDRGGCWVTARSLTNPEVYEAGWIWTAVVPPPPEQVPLTLYPLVPTRLSWTGQWVNKFSSELSLCMGGSIAPSRYAGVSGKLRISATGKEFLGGWVEYREPNWEVRAGQLSYTTPIADVSGFGLRYSYHPQNCGYQSTVYLYDSETLFHFRLKLDTAVLDLYSRLTDDFVFSGTLRSEKASLKFEIGNSVSLSISTQESPALSGSLTWGSETTLGLSGEWPPFSGRFCYTVHGSYTRVLGHLGFTTSLLRTLSFRTALEVERKCDTDLISPLDTLETKLCTVFYESARPLSWSLSCEFVNLVDRLLSVSTVTLTLKGRVTYWLTVDCSASLEAEVAQWPTGSLRSALSLGAMFPFLTGLRGELRWVLLGQEECSIYLRGADLTAWLKKKPGCLELGAEARFQAPLPLVETMGRVEGVVFVDKNMNGIQDPGEPGLPGILLQLDKEQALTGSGGVFRFYPMFPGTYQLRILTPLPTYCPQPRPPLTVQVVAGQATTVHIALVPAATISGCILIYRPANNTLNFNNKNDKHQANGWVVDRPLARARVILTNGVEHYITLTNDNGNFHFQGLCPGTWELRVELPPLAPPHHVEQEVYTLVLSPGESRTLEIRVLPIAREIRPLGELRQPVSVANPP